MRTLSGLDALFLRLETAGQPMNIAGIGIYDPASHPRGVVSYDEVLAWARRRTAAQLAYRSRLRDVPMGLDHPVWVEDPDYDIRNHIFRARLPAPGTREQLNDEIARVQARLMDRRRPLWEWWFIEGLNAVSGLAPGAFAIVFKHHHAASGGGGLIEAMRLVHDPTATAAAGLPAERVALCDPGIGGTALGRGGLAGHLAGRALSHPARVARTLGATSRLLRAAAARASDRLPKVAGLPPWTPFNEAFSGERGHAAVTFRLADMRAVRSLHPGCTANDVLMAIVGGALRRYLKHRGCLPDRSLIAAMSIATRPDWRREASYNNAALAMLPLGTDVTDPVERLRSVSTWNAQRKDYVNALPVHTLHEYLDYIPGPMIGLARAAYRSAAAAKLMRPPFNVYVLNVRWAAEVQYLVSSRMVEFETSVAVGDGATLAHAATSYADRVTLSLVFDRQALPDPYAYLSCLEAAQQELLAEAGHMPNATRPLLPR